MMFARLGKNYCATGVRDNDLRCKMFSTYSRRRALFQNIFRPYLRPYLISFARVRFFQTFQSFFSTCDFRASHLSILARSLCIRVFADHFQSLYPA